MDYLHGPGRNHLFVPHQYPGARVIRAINRNNEDYYCSHALPALTKTLLEDVKKIFKTTSGTRPFLIPTTCIGSLSSPGFWIVSFLIGQFSLLWTDQHQQQRL
ncbi:hypothetical protein PanWU01x14_283780 [Parasponia andersonii]|uniref:Uncharacterized protein n=1 Tax=Parasponia andersonii TaxID=3476 RepID=A0A2P5B066_PARAD|nr:hypothetical protein PanWU01x14_283780 [Parasponia andersonii]